MTPLIIIGLYGLAVGLVLAVIADFLENKKLIQKTKVEANIIVQEALDKQEALFQKTDENFNRHKKITLSRFDQIPGAK